VVPLRDVAAASGQVTVIEAMRMGRAVLATRSIGTEDYVYDGENGLLVEAGNPVLLADRMQQLWETESLRNRLASAAYQFADSHLSDEAAADALVRILREAAAVSLQH
jgi:glycosyltransferase involved in cell wall biosynthesis